MLTANVKTFREEIYYEYAKLISCSAHASIQYEFVTDDPPVQEASAAGYL
jgi:hypothetical protein